MPFLINVIFSVSAPKICLAGFSFHEILCFKYFLFVDRKYFLLLSADNVICVYFYSEI